MRKIILLSAVFLCCLKLTYSQPGQLDPFFGNKGIIKADLGAKVTHRVKSNKIIVRSDGSIYVLIETEEQNLIAKRKSDGTADVTYGNKGFSVPITSSRGTMAMQSDGKILVGGQIYTGYDGGTDITIARYNLDGSLDNSFGGAGVVTVSHTGSYDEPGDGLGSLVVAPNGQIIVTSSYRTYDDEGYELDRYYVNYLNSNGSTDRIFTAICGDNLSIQTDGKLVLSGGYSGHLVARYNPDGSLDNTFDNDGILLTGLPETSMCIASDGKILLAGQYEIRRYTPSGKLDLTFSGDGRLQVPFKVNSVIPFVDGKIGVAGGKATTNSENLDFAIARYTSAGTPDNTFSADGIDIINFGGNEEAYSVSKINGKMVITGTTAKGLDGFGNSFSIARYNIDGSLDNTFDLNGTLTSYLRQGNTVFNGVAVQSDGKTISVGSTWNGKNKDIIVVRYTTNGSLDNTFSYDGIHTIDFGGNEGANAAVIQSDGKIVVAGGLYILRYNSNGTLDATFSGDGKQTNKFHINKIAIQTNGKIVVCGSSLARYKIDGNLDATFAGDGDIVTPFICDDVAIQADGKIVVVGEGRDFEYKGAIARYSASGYPDNAFGVHSLDFEEHYFSAFYGVFAVALQADGKILAGGYVEPDYKGGKKYSMLFRFLSNGKLDSTFLTEGKGTLYIGTIYSIALQPDGKILVAGISDNDYGQGSSVLLRLNTNGSYDETFNGGTYHISGAADAISEVVIYKDKAIAVGYGVYPGLMGNVIRVLLAANKPPVVSITSPANNAVYYAPATINISASATDADGKISSVKFYKGTTLLTTDYSYPYTYSWSNVPAGTYYLKAKATDNFGQVTTSAVVKVTVMASNSTIVSSKPTSVNDQTDLNGTLSMRLSPNPTRSTLQIFTKGLQLNKPSTISVISASGVVMKTIQSNALNEVVQLDVSSMVSGVYTIKIISGDKVLYKQFVKL